MMKNSCKFYIKSGCSHEKHPDTKFSYWKDQQIIKELGKCSTKLCPIERN